ncbi:PKD domain-containing protein, partial [Halapricum sp. CBA1109]|uniref:PKD domain-containing protein n=1 Tax=Halapricum sp. CBA1109 TaxID=2668068 RepID=UPI0012FA9362
HGRRRAATRRRLSARRSPSTGRPRLNNGGHRQLTSGRSADGTTAIGPVPAHAYDSPGAYTATLTVADAAGNTATDTVSVVVQPAGDTTPPTAEAGPNVTVSVGDSVTLDASGSTDDQAILGYQWAFGDGSTATGETVTHTYDSPGTYTATVTVADPARNTDTDSVTVTVVGDDATEDTATVTTVPSNVTVANGSVRAVDVAVTNSSSGVESYALTLSLSNATGNATIANASVPDGTVDRPSARTVVLSGTADSTASNVTVATVRLTGVETGRVDVALTADAVTTADGGQYDALSTAGGIVEVVPGPEPLPGSAAPPRDADGDGRFEDVNGDRTADLFDALDYFNQRGSEVIRDNPGRFDFDGDGDAGDLFDALALWNEISG